MDTAVKSYCKLQAASRQSTQVRQKKVPQGIPQVMMLFHPFHLLLRMEMLVLTDVQIHQCLSEHFLIQATHLCLRAKSTPADSHNERTVLVSHYASAKHPAACSVPQEHRPPHTTHHNP
jgi:hypothetical protein